MLLKHKLSMRIGRNKNCIFVKPMILRATHKCACMTKPRTMFSFVIVVASLQLSVSLVRRRFAPVLCSCNEKPLMEVYPLGYQQTDTSVSNPDIVYSGKPNAFVKDLFVLFQDKQQLKTGRLNGEISDVDWDSIVDHDTSHPQG